MSLFSKIEEQQGSQYSGIALEGAKGRVMGRQSEKTPNPPHASETSGEFLKFTDVQVLTPEI